MTSVRTQVIDGVVALLMAVYGAFVLDTSPTVSIAAWIVGGLLLSRHLFEPFGELVEEYQHLFMLFLLSILVLGIALSI